MDSAHQSRLLDARAAFVAKLKVLREKAGLSQAELVRDMKKRGHPLSQKSVSNIERVEHDTQLSNYAAIAEHFGVPLWVMFVPGLTPELLEGEKLKRLEKLVQDYLACDDDQRGFTESMAAGYAGLNQKK